jgi:hypothetical protein
MVIEVLTPCQGVVWAERGREADIDEKQICVFPTTRVLKAKAVIQTLSKFRE